MSLVTAYKENHPRAFGSWLKMWHAIFKAMQRKGDSIILWKNMSVDKCKTHEQMAMELEYYEIACIFRDNINKCYDYEERKRITKASK